MSTLGSPRVALCLALCLAFLPGLAAWENHNQLTYLALAGQASSAVAADVRAESLESFLEAEKAGLVPLLAGLEKRALAELSFYPPLPPGLAFKAELTGPELKKSFLEAIRANPNQALPLFVQPLAWAPRTRPPLPLTAVDPFGSRVPNGPFELLAPGEMISVRELLASASDEPDYGMDVGLYEDNGTDFGKAYGLGRQAWGNPALSYGSQAPIHMSFAGEDPLIKLAAPFTQETLLPYRVMLFETLARFAFERGHDYWGWRFAGWAIHYVEDISQPYHASLLPGLNVFQILWLNVAGSAEDRQAALIYLSNRHSLIEDYLYGAMAACRGPEDGASPIYAALKGDALRSGSAAGKLPPWRAFFETDVVGKRAYGRGPELDRLLRSSFPAKYVADPAYDYGVGNFGPSREYDPFVRLRAENPEAVAKVEAALAASMADLGQAVRAFTASVSTRGAQVPPRSAPADLRGPLYLAVVALIAALIVFLALSAAKRRRAKREAR